MAGFIPAIHVFTACFKKDVDARHKAGHDDEVGFGVPRTLLCGREEAVALT